MILAGSISTLGGSMAHASLGQRFLRPRRWWLAGKMKLPVEKVITLLRLAISAVKATPR